MDETRTSVFDLSNSTYDFLKRLVQIGLPAVSALYFGLAQIWGLPGAENVVGTIAIITTFLGTILGISSRRYNPYSGEIEVTTTDNKQMFTLGLNDDPAKLADMDSVTFKIVKPE